MKTAVLLPTLPPESRQVEIPDSMHPDERAKLIAELGKISTEIATVQVRDEERAKFLDQRFRAIDARLAKIEEDADASGQFNLVELQKQLDERKAESSKWKWWALSIIATIFTSALVGLVVHYFGH